MHLTFVDGVVKASLSLFAFLALNPLRSDDVFASLLRRAAHGSRQDRHLRNCSEYIQYRIR